MNKRMLVGLPVSLVLGGTVFAASDAWNLDVLASNGVQVADYALAHPTRANHRDWTYGVFYAGLTAFGLAHPELPYLDVLRAEGTNCAWRLDGGRPFFAETHCIGQAWLELAREDDCPAALAGTRAVFDYVLENRSRAPVVQRIANGSFSSNIQRWSWSDAFFMSPPVWAKLAALTGEDRYRDYLIGEYRATLARLYDREYSLFYRDFSARDRRSANDAKVFWGRGNGWVLAGLPLVIRELPPDLKTRPIFVNLFKEMCAAVKTRQRTDGAWSPNLLDAQDPDLPETSATALFTSALMWGVNEGLLDANEYLPCVQKAWSALCRNVTFDGALGWVQQAATGPTKDFGADSTALYAVGGYLLAATEIRRYLVLAENREAKTVVVGPRAEPGVVTVSVPLDQLAPFVGGSVVFDTRTAAVVPSQLWDEDGNGTPDSLIFRTSLGAGVPREFRILAGGVSAPKVADVVVEGSPTTRFAVFLAGQSFTAAAPTSRTVVACGPVRTEVVYDFPPVTCGAGVTVRERRTVTRDRGSRFSVCRSTFTFEGVDELVGGPVLPVDGGELWANPTRGWATVKGAESRLSAIGVRNPCVLQTTEKGNAVLAVHLRANQPLTWMAGTNVISEAAFLDHAQWRDQVVRTIEEAMHPPTVRIK